MDTLVDIHTHDATPTPGATRLVCVEIDSYAPGTGFTHDRFCSGIHPWDAGSPMAESRFGRIEALARSGSLSAIGETGIDRFRQNTDLAAQASWFRRHIELSEATGRPLVIHSVKSDSDILAEHSRARPKSPWVIHACSANPVGLEQILSKGIHVSFGVREMSRAGAKACLESAYGPWFFLETDDSKTPLSEVYSKAAALTGRTVAEIAALTNANWARLFGT